MLSGATSCRGKRAEPVWNNDGDTALLRKPSGATADRCS
jgi:hypothetical protein